MGIVWQGFEGGVKVVMNGVLKGEEVFIGLKKDYRKLVGWE